MTFGEINKALSLIKIRMLELSDLILREKLYGGGCKEYYKEFETLIEYKESLLIYRNLFMEAGDCEPEAMLPDNKCCDEKDLEILLEKISLLTHKCCEVPLNDLEIDSDGYSEWVLTNPTEIPYESWEKAALGLCRLTSFSLKKRKDALCDVYFKITQDYKDCQLTFNEKITEPDCKLEYKEIFEGKECDLKYSEYLVMRQCGISIKEIVKNTNCEQEVTITLKDSSTFEGC